MRGKRDNVMLERLLKDKTQKEKENVIKPK